MRTSVADDDPALAEEARMRLQRSYLGEGDEEVCSEDIAFIATEAEA